MRRGSGEENRGGGLVGAGGSGACLGILWGFDGEGERRGDCIS